MKAMSLKSVFSVAEEAVEEHRVMADGRGGLKISKRRQERGNPNDSEALRLIRIAIVTDTVNFSEEAKKTTQDDKDIVDRIDLLLGLDTLSRTVDYQLVLAAKTDVSGLNNSQLLKKDLKVRVIF